MLSDLDISLLVVGIVLALVIIYSWRTSGFIVTWVQYIVGLFNDRGENKKLLQFSNQGENVMIRFLGLGDTCDRIYHEESKSDIIQDSEIESERIYDSGFQRERQYFKAVVCVKYPAPGIDNWLSTFFETTYSDALRYKGKIILDGFCMGGWVALNAAQYIAQHDPGNLSRIRVLAIAPMTHWRNAINWLPRKHVTLYNNYESKQYWHVYASKKDGLFEYDDIVQTYGKIATIHEVTGTHLEIKMDFNKELAMLTKL